MLCATRFRAFFFLAGSFRLLFSFQRIVFCWGFCVFFAQTLNRHTMSLSTNDCQRSRTVYHTNIYYNAKEFGSIPCACRRFLTNIEKPNAPRVCNLTFDDLPSHLQQFSNPGCKSVITYDGRAYNVRVFNECLHQNVLIGLFTYRNVAQIAAAIANTSPTLEFRFISQRVQHYIEEQIDV